MAETTRLPPVSFASDDDGVRYMILDPTDLDCSDWRIELTEKNGRSSTWNFDQGRAYGLAPHTSLIGMGTPTREEAWMVLCDWGTATAEIVFPDQSRAPVARFIVG